MSGGFPNRPSRRKFGPELSNPKVVKNPRQEADATAVGLSFFQVAGAGLMVPRAWAILDGSDGENVVITARAESWNPDRKVVAPYLAPSVSYDGVGEYSIEYETSYPDDAGNSVVLAPLFGGAIAIDPPEVRDARVVRTGTSFAIKLRELDVTYLSWMPVDGPVWFFFY